MNLRFLRSTKQSSSRVALAVAGAVLLSIFAFSPAQSGETSGLPEIVSNPNPLRNPLSSLMYYGLFDDEENAPQLPVPAPPPEKVLGGPQGTTPILEGLGIVGPNVRVTNNGNWQNEVTIAINPKNPMQMIGGANDYGFDGSPQQGAYGSNDGGKTWVRQMIPGTKAFAPMGGDPAVSFGPDGTGYYVGIAFAGGSYLTISKTTDGGMTWSPAKVIVGSRFGGLWDKPMMVADPTSGAIYVTWTMFGSGEIMFVRSTDGGNTWNAPGKVLATGTNQFSLPIPGLDGKTVHVIYISCYNGGGLTGFKCAKITTSTDGGATWSAAKEFTKITGIKTNPGFRYIPYPAADMDRTNGPGRGTIHVAWVDDGAATGPVATRSDVYAIRSLDGGSTWTTPVRVNNELSKDLASYMPWVAVNGRGTVGVAWVNYDATTKEVIASMSQSKDGSLWIETPQGSASGKASAAFFWGDYGGLAAGPSSFHPIWTDSRDGNTEVYTAEVKDVFAFLGV